MRKWCRAALLLIVLLLMSACTTLQNSSNPTVSSTTETAFNDTKQALSDESAEKSINVPTQEKESAPESPEKTESNQSESVTAPLDEPGFSEENAETSVDIPIPTEENHADKVSEMQALALSINGTPVSVQWESNDTVHELLAAAQNSTIVISASRYGNFEQVGSLPQSFSRNDVQMTTAAGDIVLYSGNQLVVFFDSNTWSYTKLGHIKGLSLEDIILLLDQEAVTFELSAK